MTERFELRSRPGSGRWRVIGTGLTFREAVQLMGAEPGKIVDYWFHKMEDNDGAVQDVSGGNRLAEEQVNGEDRTD